MRLVLIGPPGAGKGTQSTRLCHHFQIPHLSTGDILRESVRAGTEFGKMVGPLMRDGKLVSDSLINAVVKERLAQPDCDNGFLLDGFPRTVPQAEALIDMLHEMDCELNQAIEIRVPTDELTRRLKGRASQAENPRDDDSMDAIPHRLEVYRAETRPLISYYDQREKLLTVDGVGTMEEVFKRIIDGLNKAMA